MELGMVRTQIQITEVQARELKRLARQKKVSMAELIRESIDEMLRSKTTVSREELVQRSLAAVGKFRSGKGDISERHDDYLLEIYGEYKK
ncbi:MAG: ribbon-helix-helix domain-containing protein [Thermoleophilia bacterium]